MKISYQHRLQSANGHTLLPVAIAAGILSILVASYLAWVTNEFIISQRSHSWTQALYLAEAGVEAGLAELSHVYRQNPSQAFLSSNGWASSTNGYTKAINNFTNGTGKNLGNILIEVQSVGSKYPKVIGTGTAWSRGASTSIVRRVRARLRRNHTFRYGLVTKNNLNLSSNNKITIDSFDSRDPTKSTNGQYDLAKRTAQAAIVSVNDDIDLKNVNLYGTAHTGPGKQVDFFNLTSSVGATFVALDRSITEADAEIKGWVTHDAAMTITDTVLPPEFATAPNLGNIDGGYTFNSGTYNVTRLKNTNGDIFINGTVQIYCSTSVQLTGLSTLTINTGGRLELYVQGDVSIGGKGVVNVDGIAEKNMWYGLNSGSLWNMGGDAVFVGTVYAPNSTVSFIGSPTYSGAFVANTMSMGGDTKIHYDEALRSGIGNNVYTFLSWESLVLRNGNWVMETN